MNLKHLYYRVYQNVFKFAVLFLDWTPPELLTGPGSAKKLPELIKSKGIKKVIIVTGRTHSRLHLLDGLYQGLKDNGIEYVVYDQTNPNPTIDNIEEVRQLYVDNGCEAFIAFGGGSPLDCAKIAGARVVRPKTSVQKMRGVLKVIKKLPPFFAVPTTAGTGSECTIAAVVSDPQTHDKYAITDPVLRPDYAVLDPELTVGLPPKMTAATGMDALTHAVEAYIGRSNTKDTSQKAEKAVKLIFEYLEKAYQDGTDLHAREQMLIASYYAGLAFTRAYVGNVHAIAHKLGGLYNIPHGLANAIILPYVLDYYGDTAYERLARLGEIANVVDGCQTDEEKAKAFIQAIRDMNERMEIPTKIPEIKEEDLPAIAKSALREANPLYPVPKIMDTEDCIGVVRKLMP